MKTIDSASAEAAGAAAVTDARVLPGDRNKWKIPIAQAMVKRAILACSENAVGSRQLPVNFDTLYFCVFAPSR